jgi:hypothetical protein
MIFKICSCNGLFLTQFSIACAVLVRKAADEIRITIFNSFGVNKINELVVTGNRLTNNFAGLITSGLGLDVARGPPVERADIGYTAS